MNDNLPPDTPELRAAYRDLVTEVLVGARFLHNARLGLWKRPQTQARPSATIHHFPPLVLHS